MRGRKRHSVLACAVIATTLSSLVWPMAPGVSAQSASKSAATAAKAARPVDGGWPRASTTASGASLVIYQPQIASWVDQKAIAFYAAISYTPAGASKAALGTIKAESVDKRIDGRTARQPRRHPDHRFELLHAHTGSDSNVGDGDFSGHSTGRPDARPRSCARQSRQEPDHPEEHRGREGRPAPYLLQQNAGGPGQRRWRSDLECDQGQRSPIRGEHELGSVPAHPDANPISARDGYVAQGAGAAGSVDVRGDASRQLLQAAERRELESRERCAAGQEDRSERCAKGLRHHDASGIDSPERRAELRAGRRHSRLALGQQHR